MLAVIASQDSSVWSSVPAYVGATAALFSVGAALRSLLRRTVWRRRDRYDRLARLGVGAHISFFISVLGEPPAISRTIVKDVEEVVEAGDPEYVEDSDTFQVRHVSRAFGEEIFIDR